MPGPDTSGPAPAAPREADALVRSTGPYGRSDAGQSPRACRSSPQIRRHVAVDRGGNLSSTGPFRLRPGRACKPHLSGAEIPRVPGGPAPGDGVLPAAHQLPRKGSK